MHNLSKVDVIRATSPADIAAVKEIFLEYLHFIEVYLGQSLSFQGTGKEFSDFPQTYDVLLLAKVDGDPVAACGVKPFSHAGRGMGLGHALCEAAVSAAREHGYMQMYLDTDHGLTHANSIYEALGFTDIEKYYDNPMDSRFMALNLREP